MSKTRVSKAVVFCVLSAFMIAFTSDVYILKELMAALLFFSLFYWAMTTTLIILVFLAAVSWQAITWLAARTALLGPQFRHPIVRLPRAHVARN
jgi:hypothetical protein